jgi:hypothetical protein
MQEQTVGASTETSETPIATVDVAPDSGSQSEEQLWQQLTRSAAARTVTADVDNEALFWAIALCLGSRDDCGDEETSDGSMGRTLPTKTCVSTAVLKYTRCPPCIRWQVIDTLQQDQLVLR